MSNIDSSDASEQSKTVSSIESPLSLDDFAKGSVEKIKDADKTEVRVREKRISVEERRETARTFL